MSTLRRIGTYSDDYVCAQWVLHESLTEAMLLITEFAQECGGWASLPKGFAIAGEGWDEAEEALGKAAEQGDWVETIQLGREYKERTVKFLNAWRKKCAAAKAKSTAAGGRA